MAAKDLDIGENSKKQEVDDMTACCICTEVYTDPKALPCNHTFCMKCIQETGIKTNKGPGDEMPCPICRRLFKIPAEGFPRLPKNFFIERLIQVSRAMCSACLEKPGKQQEKSTPTAHRKCVECKRKLCEKCCSEHTQNKLTRNHHLIPIAEYKDEQCVKTDLATRPSVCEQHKQKVLDVYCADCKTVVCAICFIDDHKKHEGSHVDKYVDVFRKQIESNGEAINKWKDKAQIKRTKLLLVKEDIQERVKKFERDVTDRIHELKKLVDKHATSLLKGLSSAKQVKLKEIQMATDDVDTYISCLETYNSYCQKIKAKGSAGDTCDAFSYLTCRAVQLQQQCQPMIDKDIQSINLRFRKSGLEVFLNESCGNMVGEYKDNEEKSVDAKEKLRQELSEIEQRMAVLTHTKLKVLAELRYQSDPVLAQTIDTNFERNKRQWFSTANRDIRGMTILDKELFIVNKESSEVEVYDSMAFSLRRRWKLRELNDPRDIVSCQRNKCLYINSFIEYRCPCEILRVDPTGKLTGKWSEEDGGVRSLSVTCESNVILAAFEQNRLNEYSPDGQLIRKVNLSPKVRTQHLLHAIKLINGDFVISSHTICKVSIEDPDGKRKKSFDGGYIRSNEQLKYPVYLSVDANEFVMVVDEANCRVLLLDSDLKLQREILSREKHGLANPCRIVLDEINGRLFVADNKWDNQRILIFDFK